MARNQFRTPRRCGGQARCRKRLARLRAETMEEIRLYELCPGGAISPVELAGRLGVTQGATSKT